MGPESSAASDSADYFVTTIVRRLENGGRMMASSISRGVCPRALSVASSKRRHAPTPPASTPIWRNLEVDLLFAPYALGASST